MTKISYKNKFPSTTICKIEKCSKPHDARGYCNTHYAYMLRNNKLPPKISLEEKFWERVVKTNTCWNWIGYITSTGYGLIKYEKNTIHAHRLSLSIHNIELKKDLVIDHLCRNRKCVNPNHLEQVSLRENTLRGYGAPAVNKRKKECLNGHSFDEKNTFHTKIGTRQCRTCRKIRSNFYSSLKNRDQSLLKQS